MPLGLALSPEGIGAEMFLVFELACTRALRKYNPLMSPMDPVSFIAFVIVEYTMHVP